MEIVSFEIAKKLKEKGFDYPCINAINSFGCTYRNGWCEYLDDREDEFITLKDLKEGDCLLPTISQVLKWLREEKQIHIYTDIVSAGWVYNVFINVKKLEDGTWWYNGVKEEGYFDSYEQAAIAGIEYVLDNLI